MKVMSEPVRLLDHVSARSAEPLAVAAKLFRGLADPARLGILLELRMAPQSAGQFAARLGLSPSNASNHLLCLLECGLVSVDSDGRHNVYRLADPAVEHLLDASAELLAAVAPAIEACLKYGPPSRRALRPRRQSPSRRSDEGPSADG